MKKLLVTALVLAALPLFGQAPGIEWGATVDAYYFMLTPADSDDATIDSSEIGDSFFGEVNAALTAKFTLPGDIAGGMKIGVSDVSSGINAAGPIDLDEIWAKKSGAFGQDALSFQFGKFDIPMNLNVDNGVTHAFTYGNALVSDGIGAINNTWGFCVGYKVEGAGQFYLTTYEGLSGVTLVDEADEDSGLFTSMALNWDTGADAFGVAGLRLVAGFGMRATVDDEDNGSIISVGGTYTIPGVPLVVSLEIDSTTFMAPDSVGLGIYMDAEGAMLMALGADYTVNEQFSVGLKYESIAYAENEDIAMDANADSRIALYGSYVLAEGSAIRFEYSTVANDTEAADFDSDGDDDEFGYSGIAIGFTGKI